MSWKFWLSAVGISGIYYLIKHGEFKTFSTSTKWEDPDNVCVPAIQAWINAGATFAQTNTTFKAIMDAVNSFNDFMDNLDDNIWDSLKIVDESTGLLKIPDLTITLPNGLSLTVIDGEQVQDFRINESATLWRGYYHGIPNFRPGFYSFLAFRLKEDPSFEFRMPGTENWNYVDYDGVVKPGSSCTPEKAFYDTDIMYISAWIELAGIIYEILKSLGLTTLCSAWYSKMYLRRNFKKSHELSEQIQDDIAGLSINNIDLHSDSGFKLDTLLSRKPRSNY